MSTISNSRGTARLRLLLTQVVADNYKAYDLPMLGERLGLAPGTDAEAMSCKRLYMSKRLQALPDLKNLASLVGDTLGKVVFQSLATGVFLLGHNLAAG